MAAAITAAVFVSAPAVAAPGVKSAVKTDSVVLSGSERAQVITKLENYLNGLKTLRAGFRQVIPGEAMASGTFYLKRPGRFLWQYIYPGQERLISTGKNLYFYDTESQQVTELPRQTPMVKLLGSEGVSFNGAGLRVQELRREGPRLRVNLSLNDPEAELATQVTLVFQEKPLQLAEFITQNQLNQRVRVSFFDYTPGVELADSLFKFTPTLKKNPNEAFGE